MVENEIYLISGIKIYKQTILEDYAALQRLIGFICYACETQIGIQDSATIQYGHIEMASWIK